MLAAGVQLRQYISVDINPDSEEVMRQTLVPVIGTERFAYLIMDSYKCSMADFPNPRGGTREQDDFVTVMTNKLRNGAEVKFRHYILLVYPE